MDTEKRCHNCQTEDQWTNPAYNKWAVLQIGCWNCFWVFNIIDGEYISVGQVFEHFIFWKDLRRQWDEVVTKCASSVKKKDA